MIGIDEHVSLLAPKKEEKKRKKKKSAALAPWSCSLQPTRGRAGATHHSLDSHAPSAAAAVTPSLVLFFPFFGGVKGGGREKAYMSNNMKKYSAFLRHVGRGTPKSHACPHHGCLGQLASLAMSCSPVQFLFLIFFI